MKNDEEFGKVDALGINRVALMDINEVRESAERRLGLGGYTAGTDQWLIWEAIRNICLELEARSETGTTVGLQDGSNESDAPRTAPQRGKREAPAFTPNEGDDPPLRVSRSRVNLREDTTGYYVRAMFGGSWDTYDIAQLDRKSFRTWLRYWNQEQIIDIFVRIMHGDE